MHEQIARIIALVEVLAQQVATDNKVLDDALAKLGDKIIEF